MKSQINLIQSFCNIPRVDFIFSILRKFEYGDKFIHMIKVTHNNIESKIKTNDLVADLLILMSLHQRCLLSMRLYNIMTEVLSNFINTDKIINRIQIGYHEIKTENFKQ